MGRSQESLRPDTLISVLGCDAVVTLWMLAGRRSCTQDGMPAAVMCHTLPGGSIMDQVGAGVVCVCTYLGAVAMKMCCGANH